jgi:hypothetical protein
MIHRKPLGVLGQGTVYPPYSDIKRMTIPLRARALGRVFELAAIALKNDFMVCDIKKTKR